MRSIHAIVSSGLLIVRVLLIVATSASALGLALVAGRSLADRPRGSSDGQVGSSAANLTPHENPTLGYRIALPTSYRRSSSTLTGDAEIIGRDVYTFLTESDERANCLRDGSDAPDRANAAYIHVVVWRNAAGLAAMDWARTSPYTTPRTRVEAGSIGGHDAARLVDNGQTMSYSIRANDRIYVLTPTMWVSPPDHKLDDIAATFTATRPQPLPAATPRPQPREAAAQVGRALATAFATRDANAVARHMSHCRFGIRTILEPVQRGAESCCIVNRSVGAFAEALRTRFASRDFIVMVDPEPQVTVVGQGAGRHERFWLRSDWSDAGQTTRIDLFVGEVEGTWVWFEAVHHHPRQDLSRTTCGPYRTPWVAGPGGC